MAINGIELEVGQKWLTRGGQRVEIVSGPRKNTPWPFVVSHPLTQHYSVDEDGYAMDIAAPRDTDLVQPLRRDSDHAAPLPTAEPQDANTVTSAQVNDWIDWHGGECPVDPSTPVEVRFRGTAYLSSFEQPGDLRWHHTGEGGDIVDGGRPGPLQTMVREAMSGVFGKLGQPDAYGMHEALPAMAEPLRVVGDINSTAKGSGARYNGGKAPLELIPLSIIVPFFQNDESLTDAQQRALRALDALGMFQAREGGVYDVLRELGDHWEGCAQVFDYGRRKYAEWNWAKGMKWSVPIGCAARHLMAVIRGETHDPESGKPHEWHVYCNVVMLLTYASTFAEGDDRPVKGMLL